MGRLLFNVSSSGLMISPATAIEQYTLIVEIWYWKKLYLQLCIICHFNK